MTIFGYLVYYVGMVSVTIFGFLMPQGIVILHLLLLPITTWLMYRLRSTTSRMMRQMVVRGRQRALSGEIYIFT